VESISPDPEGPGRGGAGGIEPARLEDGGMKLLRAIGHVIEVLLWDIFIRRGWLRERERQRRGNKQS